MTVPDELAWLDALSRILERAHLWRPEEIAETVAATMSRLGITATVYLVDATQMPAGRTISRTAISGVKVRLK